MYIGHCPESTSGTIKIVTKKKTLIRRNLLSVGYDETFASRYMLPELEHLFLYPNSIIRLEEVNPDLNQPKTVDIGATIEENRPKLIIAHVNEKQEIPRNLDEVRFSKERARWVKTAKDEIDKLIKFGTFRFKHISEVPEDFDVFPSKFVFNIKRSGKYSARLVAGGHLQGDSFFGIYNGSPTSSHESMKIFLVLVVEKQMFIYGIDFEGAYLNAVLEKYIYISFPKGISLITGLKE